MEIKRTKSSIAIVLSFLIAVCVLQCTPKTQVIKEDEEATLKRRVQEYWTSRVKGEWDKCYQYESPDNKEKIDIQQYTIRNKRSVVKWEGFDILEIWTSGGEGFVKLNKKYRYLIPKISEKGIFERVEDEKWLKKDGHWYRITPPI
jgi:hypothetical protein